MKYSQWECLPFRGAGISVELKDQEVALSKVANAIYSGEKLLPSLYNQIAF